MKGKWVESILQFVVLPLLILIWISLLVMYWDHKTSQLKMQQDLCLEQIESAKQIMNNVVTDMNRLYSHLRHSAWMVAFRRAQPDGTFNEDLIEEDEHHWAEFIKAWRTWQCRTIHHRIGMETFFGDHACRLYRIVDATFDKLGQEIWSVYHAMPDNNVDDKSKVDSKQDQHWNSSPVLTSFKALKWRDFSLDDEQKAHQVMTDAFDQLHDKIVLLSQDLLLQVQKRNVGLLRKGKKRRMGSRSDPAKKSI